ncbi:MAG: hypothetical protein US40_C0004G0079 [Candidatus Roizmanbacteria bacterium GW2011_GWC2_37_13]|uniref:Uncharacterized protein n=1 Tax=Candidatus Roizmanbacteria bacterium GW2011_GWC2_37_13 TaxID=1618486 RepID=A0A0G0IPD7_9BACT|nr:MAG: hypothetical protein US38_C0001G0066 [Candidatus Roizmanbacteria bacterium GW2011_GWC1_37_12]KKQ26044.1 MAG: hypothetical protein US40_C0004G0079 [Candidatus Roizmanbacteria bacterium GW2011_GWC2_37_13]
MRRESHALRNIIVSLGLLASPYLCRWASPEFYTSVIGYAIPIACLTIGVISVGVALALKNRPNHYIDGRAVDSIETHIDFTGKITNIKTTEKTPFWRRNINTTRSVLVIHNQDGSEERK